MKTRSRQERWEQPDLAKEFSKNLMQRKKHKSWRENEKSKSIGSEALAETEEIANTPVNIVFPFLFNLSFNKRSLKMK